MCVIVTGGCILRKVTSSGRTVGCLRVIPVRTVYSPLSRDVNLSHTKRT